MKNEAGRSRNAEVGKKTKYGILKSEIGKIVLSKTVGFQP